MTPKIGKVAEDATVMTFARAANSFLSLLTLVIVVRILGKSEYGLIVLARSIVNTAEIFLSFGILDFVVAEISLERGNGHLGQAKAIIIRYSKVEIVIGIILFLLILSAAIYIRRGLFRELLLISSCLVIITAMSNILRVVFNSHFNFKSTSLMNISRSLSCLVLVIVFGYWLELGPKWIMLAYVLSSAIAILFAFRGYARIMQNYVMVPEVADEKFWKNLISRGKWVGSSFAIKTFTDGVAVWVPQVILGSESVAIFNIAKKAYSHTIAILASIERILLTLIPQEISDIQLTKRIVNRSTKYSLWLSVLLILIAVPLARPTFHLLFSGRYSSSAAIFQILILVSCLQGLNIAMRPLFFALHAVRYLCIVYAINFIVFTCFAVILTPVYGLYGMSLVFILNGLLMFLLRYMYIRRIGIRILFADMFRFNEDDRRLIKEILSTVRCKIGQAIRGCYRVGT